MRSHTPSKSTTHPDGRTSTTHTVQRVCNGCGNTIGDVTDDEMDRAVAGLPLLDVRRECPWCAPFLTETAS